ncbi:hypothetical protein B0H15DRAFT_800419 [Mycena belliarum]|uniref:Arrestin-like N-terminal domain-containing protein n=1 Tax=Mycena belliarum TaxID=1033014 RepID=A0AAD6U3W4_9AGAR|nr:hypothetical protein B0H15DRAFT_800419 [Mycena belliae]
MSLLRDVLKKHKDGAGKRDTASIRSAGARSLVASLYSLTVGGQRIEKRRRSDFSTLGAPEWHHDDPPQPPDMPGTAPTTNIGAYIIAHGAVLPLRIDEKNHWLSVVLFNHASDASLAAMYHNEARVMGEVRLCLEKTKNISSIDVWLTATAPAGQIVSLTANVWSRAKGNPLRTDAQHAPFKGKFPQGAFIFPFELPPLPKFVPVTHPDNDTRKTKGLVPLPPSGRITYTCGVGVRRDSVGGIDEDMDLILQYIPLARPLPRAPTPFPFLATREDWPLKRETLGGWVLSPFGGRGRIGTQAVEIEGIVRPNQLVLSRALRIVVSQLGVQDPVAYTAGQTLEFELLLWSKSAEALRLLAQPKAVSVGFYKADFLPSSEALRPREQSRQTRTLERVAVGRAWVADEGQPSSREAAPALSALDLPAGEESHPKPKLAAAKGSRMQSVWTAENDAGSPSPPDSTEDLTDGFDLPVTDHFQRLRGALRIPPCRPVSYRYTEIGREYSLQLHLADPQYAHISPRGGLVAEVPVWYVADRALAGPPAALNDDEEYLAGLPLKGATVPIQGAVRWPRAVGVVATQPRGGKPKIGQSFIGLTPPPREGS